MQSFDAKDIQKRMTAAHRLLIEPTITRQTFEHIRTIIKGIHPHIDKKLDGSSRLLSDLEKLQKGEVIQFTLENLPEETEEQKKRKRSLLLFIRSFKDLKRPQFLPLLVLPQRPKFR